MPTLRRLWKGVLELTIHFSFKVRSKIVRTVRSPMYKTTQEDLEIFESAARKKIVAYGLLDWKVRIIRGKLDEDEAAKCGTSVIDRMATLSLSTTLDEKPDKERLDYLGEHEAYELLLAPLIAAAHYRYITSGEIKEATHSIIQRLLNAHKGRTR